MKRALITGIAGQDGTYLSQFLLDRDYEVFGIINPNSSNKSDSTKKPLSSVIIQHLRHTQKMTWEIVLSPLF